MDTLRLICPNLRCRQPLTAPAKVRGTLMTCRFCRTAFKVPAAKAGAPAQPADGGGTSPGATAS